MDFRDREGHMMQPRSGIVDEDDVVRITLALQEHGAELIAAIGHDVFRQPEAHRHVELAGGPHRGREHLDVVDALRAGAVEGLEMHDASRLGLHGRAKLKRCADNIGGVQGSVLERRVDPPCRQTALAEMSLRQVEILLGQHAQADTFALWLGAGLEYKAVVTAFFQAAQIERVAVVVAHHEAKRVDVERAALREVAHAFTT